jgi:AraC family transcriptional regulator
MAAKLERGRFLGRTLRSRQVGDLLLADVEYAAGARLPRHTHERPYFCLIRQGTYTEQYSRRSRVCRPAMLVFHPPGEQHAEAFGGESVSSLNVELGPNWLSRMRDSGLPIDQPAELHREAADLGHALFRELLKTDSHSDLAIESLTASILARLRPRGGPAGGTMPRWLQEAPDMVDAHPGHPLTLAAAAAAAGVHPVHFAASFRRWYGCSLGEYGRRRRIELARRQLEHPDRPLAVIAAEAGFADQSHFTRVFKRFTGLTPAEYRTFLPFKTR